MRDLRSVDWQGMSEKLSPFKGIIRSPGPVFGDIGTSPSCTITVVFLPSEVSS
jgi:K+ transporter